ncbi:HesA/MoeB/ThiF family protein [Aminobacterium sp. MB27-C1]|uniref:HesA/MoeB/ThiF family protein n=1 Tax=Aminobacterium sp. MB27-C1 TaxID=3070661 RepID=UPI001BCB8947|nr:HesA/MoeB/ThiF family protein [Aminobacterium sp. MB27-C1]WMI71178.1 HesA/MoeB/ThiF family protein [Aminobacterium sp. MB27-C1]
MSFHRYDRNRGTLGIEGQDRLFRSRVLVVGCGGLGGVVVEILARAGVGMLTLVDGDVFSESNLNRQLLAREKDIGTLKVEVAQKRVSAINSEVQTRVIPFMLSEQNCRDFLQNVDLVIDALDSNDARQILYRECASAKIPVIHGALGGMIGQVGRYKPWQKTHFDLFENPLPNQGIEKDLGTPSFTPFVIGSLEASEAIKYLAGVESVRWGTLTFIDLAMMSMETIEL